MAKKESKKEVTAKIIAKAWKDPQFKQKLLKNPKAALQEMGYSLPANLEVRVIEDKPTTFTFVLPSFEGVEKELSDKEIEAIVGGAGCLETASFTGCGW